jgi:hypothetical protein
MLVSGHACTGAENMGKNTESNYWCLIGIHFIPRLVQLTMSHQIIGVVNIPVFMVVPAFISFRLSNRQVILAIPVNPETEFLD